MNNTLSYFFFLAIICIFSSCNDACDDINCGPNGQCDEGICLCDDGFEGDNCETATRDRFLGFWDANVYSCDFGSNSPIDYTFAAGDNPTEIEITTTTTPVLLLIGTVIDSTSFEIKPQIIFLGVDVNYYGNAQLENDRLTLEITKGADSQTEITCKGTYLKG